MSDTTIDVQATVGEVIVRRPEDKEKEDRKNKMKKLTDELVNAHTSQTRKDDPAEDAPDMVKRLINIRNKRKVW